MSQPTNVLHLLGTAREEGSGIARIVDALANGIDPQKYNVHVWFLGPDGPLVAELADKGIAARRVGWQDGVRDPLGALRFWRQLRSEDFGIVHQHQGARSIRRMVRIASRAKIIVHVHSSRQILEGAGSAKGPVAVRGADAIIAVSEFIARQLPIQKVDVVYSSIPNYEEAGPANSHRGGAIVIGTASRLVESKGIGDLIAAFALLNRDLPFTRLEIAGSGPQQRALSVAAQDYGIAECVTFLGWCNNVRRLLRSWDLFVMPSHDEGLPIAVLEAMAEGLPVIATDVGGIPELVQNDQTGYLIRANDVRGMYVALHRLVASPELMCRLGNAGRLRAQTIFSMDKMVSKMETIYDRLISET